MFQNFQVYVHILKNIINVNNNIFDVNIIKKTWGDDINALQYTKEKSKYQSKYQSTPLVKYCRERNINGVNICLDMGGRSDIPDSDGMFATDLLFIGRVNENVVEQIMTLLLNKTRELKMNRVVFEMYYKEYIGKFFGEIINKIVLVEQVKI